MKESSCCERARSSKPSSAQSSVPIPLLQNQSTPLTVCPTFAIKLKSIRVYRPIEPFLWVRAVTELPNSETYKQGQTIFAQGQAGSAAYIVRKGAVRIYRETESGRMTIALRRPGEVIGEMALVSGACRSATAMADSDCVLMVITRSEIEQRMETVDPILKIILLTAYERLREFAERNDYYVPAGKA